MTKDNLLSRISIYPNICFSKSFICGHQIGVSMVLDCLARRETVEELKLDENDENIDARVISRLCLPGQDLAAVLGQSLNLMLELEANK